jgi:hypothetical protein
MIAACSSTTEPGTLRGRFVMEGGFTDRTVPVRGTVILHRRHGPAIRLATGRDGRFRTTLSTGPVTVRGSSPHYNGGTESCGSRRPVAIRSGATTTTEVVCFIR